MALVSGPAAIKGIQSWTLETRRHRGPIYAMALSPDQQFLATGGLDGTIRLWDVQSGQFLRALVGHNQSILGLSWSPDGNTLASAGGWDGTARLWNPRKGQPLRVLRGHKGYVVHVAWSPDGKTLISAGGRDGFVVRWEAVSGKQTRTIELGRPVLCVAWSPDGKTLAVSGQDFAGLLYDSFLSDKPRTYLNQDLGENTIANVAWSPDGKVLAGGDSKKTYLWEAATGKRLQAWEVPSQSLAWSPDGNLLAAAYQSVIRLHDVDSGKVNKTLTETAQALTWPATSSRLISLSQYRVSLWDVTAAKPYQTLEVGESLSFTWAPGKPIISGVGGKNLSVWETATGKHLATLEGHTAPVTAVAWSSSGKTLASAGSDKTVRLWEAATGQHLATLEGHTAPVTALAWSPSGKKLASGGSDKTVRLWETSAGKLLATLPHDRPVQAVAWAPNGQFLASGDSLQSIHLWRGDKGPPVLTLKTSGPVQSLAWAPNSKVLASSNSGIYHAMRFWEVPAGRLSLAMDKIGYYSPTLVWSPNGALLASIGNSYHVPIWDSRTGKVLHSYWAMGPVHNVAWTSSGTKIGAGLTTRTVLFWNAQTNQRQGALVGTDQWIAAITAKGHFGATPGVDTDLVYVALTERGLETLEPKAFAAKFSWKNTPASAFAELTAK